MTSALEDIDQDIDRPADGVASPPLIIDIDGFAGPLDLLLTLAREQKLDLRRISIRELADQYLAFIVGAVRPDLEIAGEYLVMAAWLAYLKSRLLLPEPEADGVPSSEELADALAIRLKRLDAMRTATAALFARPRLGLAFHRRGCPEEPRVPEAALAPVDLNAVVSAYGDVLRRRRRQAPLTIAPSNLMSIDQALARIRRMVGQVPDWESLVRYLPDGTLAGLRRGDLSARAALAATFGAALELARQRVLRLHQVRPFGPIYLKAAAGDHRGSDPA
jgi:segregation and condensation protein A